MQIGRVTARGTYFLVSEDAYDAGEPTNETGRLDELIVQLYDRQASGEIEDVILQIANLRLPADVVGEIFSAIDLVRKR